MLICKDQKEEIMGRKNKKNTTGRDACRYSQDRRSHHIKRSEVTKITKLKERTVAEDSDPLMTLEYFLKYHEEMECFTGPDSIAGVIQSSDYVDRAFHELYAFKKTSCDKLDQKARLKDVTDGPCESIPGKCGLFFQRHPSEQILTIDGIKSPALKKFSEQICSHHTRLENSLAYMFLVLMLSVTLCCIKKGSDRCRHRRPSRHRRAQRPNLRRHLPDDIESQRRPRQPLSQDAIDAVRL